jgi:hypothetical protein
MAKLSMNNVRAGFCSFHAGVNLQKKKNIFGYIFLFFSLLPLFPIFFFFFSFSFTKTWTDEKTRRENRRRGTRNLDLSCARKKSAIINEVRGLGGGGGGTTRWAACNTRNNDYDEQHPVTSVSSMLASVGTPRELSSLVQGDQNHSKETKE